MGGGATGGVATGAQDASPHAGHVANVEGAIVPQIKQRWLGVLIGCSVQRLDGAQDAIE